MNEQPQGPGAMVVPIHYPGAGSVNERVKLAGYMVFGGVDYDTAGGADDLIGTRWGLAEAKALAEQTPSSGYAELSWYQIFDLEEHRIILRGRRLPGKPIGWAWTNNPDPEVA